ncbi:MAG: 16S rRNA (cytidine1402-2'-O)-methyltransferase [Sphingobacteriales bacterium]|jgi:16S rRNA (cytidine1402-2'-O)-methyltransferase
MDNQKTETSNSNQRPFPGLVLVPTPIGNLDDFTFRAVKTLQAVDSILAEDTRTSGKLLSHYEISKPLIPFHAHNEHKILEQLVQRMKSGEKFALVTDAGTPSISDPGFLLVREALANDIEVESLPGASAFLVALVNSGLPADRFVFEGFLPQKKGRQTRLEILKEETKTMILYESPHRLVKCLTQLAEYLGEDRQASVHRELTKRFEENVRGPLSDLVKHFSKGTVKGEVVICIAGKGK